MDSIAGLATLCRTWLECPVLLTWDHSFSKWWPLIRATTKTSRFLTSSTISYSRLTTVSSSYRLIDCLDWLYKGLIQKVFFIHPCFISFSSRRVKKPNLFSLPAYTNLSYELFIAHPVVLSLILSCSLLINYNWTIAKHCSLIVIINVLKF